jgi:serine phosphatase RsbU (regulator of sigma subunit)
MDEGISIQGRSKFDSLIKIARFFWPGLETLADQKMLIGAGDVISFLYTIPLATAGLVWLAISTNLDIILEHPFFFLLNLGLIYLFNKISYFIIIEIRTDRYGSSEESLATMILWSAVLLLGPTALWLGVISLGAAFINLFRQATTTAARWNLARNFSFSISANTLGILLSLFIYKQIGGTIPISELTLSVILRGLVAFLVHFASITLIWSGYILYHLEVQRAIAAEWTIRPIIRFFFLSIGPSFLAQPFSILLSGLYVQNGLTVYIFLLIGLLLVAYIARQLSWVAESNRQQTRQLEQLEQLSRAIFESLPDISTLPDLLREHIPNMFPSGHISIWISPNDQLLDYPDDWPPASESMKEWVVRQIGPDAFRVKDPLPWEPDAREHQAMITAPIHERGSGRAIGGICIELRTLAQPWDRRSLANLFPATLSLADQIASALHQADVYRQSLEYQQVTQELQLAGRIQASFLPNKFPSMAGWQLSVTLLPARETSGDYFDVIELEKNKLGILIADVADKGIGSALYMALSRTLIRTYAEEYAADPEVVFFAANNRLLKDARANLFITAFYAILDLETGDMSYCNAGHNPPYLIRNQEPVKVEALSRTGIPMGIEVNTTWTRETVQINPGDVLLLFTDGIPDAQNEEGAFFDDESILEVARENIGRLAFEIQSEILDRLQQFVGNAPQSDDITLMVLIRDK